MARSALAGWTNHGEPGNRPGDRDASTTAKSPLPPILDLAMEASGIGFKNLRSAPLSRAATQQMHLAGFRTEEEYLAWLRAHPAEARELAWRLLNRTTRFFRDPEAYAALKDQVLRPLVRSRRDDGPIRIWVAGCATGEEAYSIGILLLECLGEADLVCPCKIFATDISPAVLRTARSGVYPARALQGLSPERLAQFFRRTKGGYQVVEPLRNLCLFSQRDLAVQHPFSRLDLISCRNVLIYMTPGVRGRILERFHRALRPGAFLLLGRGESPHFTSRLFKRLDHGGIFTRNPSGRRR